MKYLTLLLLLTLASCSKEDDVLPTVSNSKSIVEYNYYYNEQIQVKDNVTGQVIFTSLPMQFNTHHIALVKIQADTIYSTFRYVNDTLECNSNMYTSPGMVRSFNFTSNPKKIYLTSEQFTFIFILKPTFELPDWKYLDCNN